MCKQHLKIDYNLNSSRFGQKKEQSLDIEYTLDKKMDRNRWQECSISISLRGIAKIDSFVGNYVFDVINIYLNHNNMELKSGKRYIFKRDSYYDMFNNLFKYSFNK